MSRKSRANPSKHTGREEWNRSAYRSLRLNLPYLFTYEKYPELNIPNTTNSFDGCFAYLKQLVRVHRGVKKKSQA
jgi:hypothetical protein